MAFEDVAALPLKFTYRFAASELVQIVMRLLAPDNVTVVEDEGMLPFTDVMLDCKTLLGISLTIGCANVTETPSKNRAVSNPKYLFIFSPHLILAETSPPLPPFAFRVPRLHFPAYLSPTASFGLVHPADCQAQYLATLYFLRRHKCRY